MCDWRLADGAGQTFATFLQQSLEVDQQHLYVIRGPLDLAAFMPLSGVSGLRPATLRTLAATTVTRRRSAAEHIQVLAQRDVVLFQPYEQIRSGRPAG